MGCVCVCVCVCVCAALVCCSFNASTDLTVFLYEGYQLVQLVLLADRTVGCAFGTLCRLSSVCDVLYCGETVRLS